MKCGHFHTQLPAPGCRHGLALASSHHSPWVDQNTTEAWVHHGQPASQPASSNGGEYSFGGTVNTTQHILDNVRVLNDALQFRENTLVDSD